jgi:hypothetical protein
MNTRNRIPLQIIGYGLYLYFLGLSFRNAAKALSFLLIVKIVVFLFGTGFKKYKLKKIKKEEYRGIFLYTKR